MSRQYLSKIFNTIRAFDIREGKIADLPDHGAAQAINQHQKPIDLNHRYFLIYQAKHKIDPYGKQRAADTAFNGFIRADMRERMMPANQHPGEICKDIRTPCAAHDTEHHKEKSVILQPANKNDITQKTGNDKCNKHRHGCFAELGMFKIYHQNNKQREQINK